MVTVVIVYGTALALLLALGYWRVNLRKGSYDLEIMAVWDNLTNDEKRRRLLSPTFVGAANRHAGRYPKTVNWVRNSSLVLGADRAQLDSMFADYLGEVRRSDRTASSQEWHSALVEIKRWVLTEPSG